MSKHNYQEMSRAELKKYVLTHKDDGEAIRELFARPRPGAIHLQNDMLPEEIEYFIQEKIVNQVDRSE